MALTLCAAALCATAACKKEAPSATGGGAAPASGGTAPAPAGAAAPAAGASNKLVIGVMSDMSGLYADLGGKGSVIAAQMAAEEVGNTVAGMPIEIISADHQNKADIGSNIAREWYDTKNVDVIVDVPTSSVALAVAPITKDKNKVFLVNGAAASDLTGEKCTPNTVHWAYDTWALANAAGREIVKNGGDTWFFMTVDYAFGTALERDTRAAIEASGGKVLGAVKHPLNTPDFSSFLLQAQNSKAKIVALANAGGDTINSIKQASEFGITAKGQQMAGLLVFIADINALGLPVAKGLILSESFYWDRDDNTRAWSKKFAAKLDGKMPTMIHAGVYTSLLHYFKAVNELKSAKDGKAVVDKMKATPTDDTLFGKGTIDPNGRKRHAMYVYQVKTPEESKAKWDYYKLIREVPADQAFRKPADSGCPLVAK
ncbi:MAG TPA: ABC transporter substrate-binding protein [Kofleriaceae bacterium]|nr:ABC transporter substrate-binding protein [Kofleriaceae bacterium]